MPEVATFLLILYVLYESEDQMQKMHVQEWLSKERVWVTLRRCDG
ncbi:unnamed protein product [Chondrus crispus]|uniref:Uncharacterized protein n=1 Tax=Chondrus crispus TaxID=2769 RepID=R7QF88_CHOCR|nr:unnamed protein product [Chondrus crispus]CDF36428.1 unnamed protein product [Chondrus crispus]|eukprot:XP_005716247.1 unnamed protein product [Chondrus crispus]